MRWIRRVCCYNKFDPLKCLVWSDLNTLLINSQRVLRVLYILYLEMYPHSSTQFYSTKIYSLIIKINKRRHQKLILRYWRFRLDYFLMANYVLSLLLIQFFSVQVVKQALDLPLCLLEDFSNQSVHVILLFILDSNFNFALNGQFTSLSFSIYFFRNKLSITWGLLTTLS